MKYNLMVTQVLRKSVRVEAESIPIAANKVRDMLCSGGLEIGDGDVAETRVEPMDVFLVSASVTPYPGLLTDPDYCVDVDLTGGADAPRG